MRVSGRRGRTARLRGPRVPDRIRSPIPLLAPVAFDDNGAGSLRDRGSLSVSTCRILAELVFRPRSGSPGPGCCMSSADLYRHRQISDLGMCPAHAGACESRWGEAVSLGHSVRAHSLSRPADPSRTDSAAVRAPASHSRRCWIASTIRSGGMRSGQTIAPTRTTVGMPNTRIHSRLVTRLPFHRPSAGAAGRGRAARQRRAMLRGCPASRGRPPGTARTAPTHETTAGPSWSVSRPVWSGIETGCSRRPPLRFPNFQRDEQATDDLGRCDLERLRLKRLRGAFG